MSAMVNSVPDRLVRCCQCDVVTRYRSATTHELWLPPCVRACLLQWAKIILIIEQTMTTEARRHQQKRYSQPMKDKRRALPIRWDRREGIRRSGLSLSLSAPVSLCSFAPFSCSRLHGRLIRIAVLPSVCPSLLLSQVRSVSASPSRRSLTFQGPDLV